MTGVRIVAGDLHIPFHDKRAVRLLLDTIERVKPDGLDLMGDIGDFYSISKFDKDPSRKLLVVDELQAVKSFLDKVDQVAPRSCDKRFGEGNHEDRLRKLVWSKAPALVGLPELTTQGLFGLRDRGYKFYDYSSPYRIGQLWYHHGKIIRKKSGASAHAAMEVVGENVIVNHCHRLAHVYHRTWARTIQGWENGCLCTLNPEYLVHPDWQQGFSIVRYGAGRSFGVEQVQIRHGKCWVGGREFKPDHPKRRPRASTTR